MNINAMVAMRVVLLHGCALSVFIVLNDGVDVLGPAPVDEVGKHFLNFGQVELARTAEPQDVVVVEVKLVEIGYLRGDNPLLELSGDGVLFGTGVAHEARVDAFLARAREKWHSSVVSFD